MEPNFAITKSRHSIRHYIKYYHHSVNPGKNKWLVTLTFHSSRSELKFIIALRRWCVNIYVPVVFFVRAAKLQLESSLLEGSVVVRIRSVKENSYICVSSDGNLTMEVGVSLALRNDLNW